MLTCTALFHWGKTSWTRNRQSVQHSVPVDRTLSSYSSCLFWKLGGGQRCHGVPRSVAALTVCYLDKGGNTMIHGFLFGSRQSYAAFTCRGSHQILCGAL